MTSLLLHPKELAYAFSYSKTLDVIGWGRDPFLPEGKGDLAAWYNDGAARLHAEGHLIGTPDTGTDFSADFSTAVLALADPTVVLLAQRKEGAGLRRMTVHVAGETVLAMTQRTDGMFELTRYADMTAAAVACSGFLGAALKPDTAGTRVESDRETLSTLHQQATGGQTDGAHAQLVQMDVSEQDAASILQAFSMPAVAGTLSVFYCADNVALNAQAFSVMTTQQDETWIMFTPASPTGPMVLERSSIPALSGRVLMGVAARLRLAA